MKRFKGAQMQYLKPTTHQLAALIGLVVSAVTLPAQGNPTLELTRFAGTWKEDLSKTVHNVVEADIRKYEQNPDGGMSVTIGTGATAYHETFRVDGKPYPITSHPGEMQRWTHPDPATWESSITHNGVPPYAVRRTVSSDGAALTFETIFKANGNQIIDKIAYKRISVEKNGLVGTWKPDLKTWIRQASSAFESRLTVRSPLRRFLKLQGKT